MIERIEGTFYLIDPETEEATYEIKFHVDDEHSEQWGATKNQLIEAKTLKLLVELQKVLVTFNHPEIYGEL